MIGNNRLDQFIEERGGRRKHNDRGTARGGKACGARSFEPDQGPYASHNSLMLHVIFKQAKLAPSDRLHPE